MTGLTSVIEQTKKSMMIMPNRIAYHHGFTIITLQDEGYLRPLPTSHKINPTTNTTTRIPTHTPALKMPPTTSQDDNVIAVANAKSPNKEYCFMSSSFWGILQKVCR